jgi:WhiB family transcriptional regulator, redox-sensing transcriptional regulator
VDGVTMNRKKPRTVAQGWVPTRRRAAQHPTTGLRQGLTRTGREPDLAGMGTAVAMMDAIIADLFVDPPTWHAQAACADMDRDRFFPGPGGSNGAQTQQAKAVCAACPVRADCLAEALEHDLQGIWGGLTDRERTALKRDAHGRANESG